MSIESLEKRLIELEKRVTKLEELKDKIKHNNFNQYDDSTIAILDLIKESFFDTPKKLKDIVKQLKTNATFSSLKECKKSLKILVRDKHIRRKQMEHQWMYSKYDK